MAATRKVRVQEDPWMTLSAAANALGTTRHTLLKRIVKGELIGKIVANRTVVSRESVERLQRA